MYENIKEKHRGSLHSINVTALKIDTMVESRSVLDSDPEELIFNYMFISSNHIVIEENISLLRIHDQYLKKPDMASWVRKII